MSPADSTSLPRLLSAQDVSDATGLPKWRVYELTRSDDIPHVRLGRAVRYSAQALAEWIDQGGTGQWNAPDSV